MTRKIHKRTTFIAKTVSGLEEVLAGELTGLGAVNATVLKRAVRFEGDSALMFRANYCARTALRVLRPLLTFEIREQEDLYRKILDIAWEDYFDRRMTFAVDAVIGDTVFSNSKFVALRTKDAIADRLRKVWNARPYVKLDKPDLRINVHIYRNTCTVSLDSSGDSLHKRGYRKNALMAPINEVLASGLILLTGWDGNTPFTDPMCGSGTLPIEAAMISNNIPSGYFREGFGFMNWKDFDMGVWHKVKENADRMIIHNPARIFGSDVSPKAVEAAVGNIRPAGLSDKITVEVCPIETVAPKEKSGIVVTNPPYDERLAVTDMIALYRTIGDVLKKRFTGHTAWVISSDRNALKFIGLHPSKKITVYNGPLECRFVRFNLY